MSAAAGVTAVIPVHNRAELLERLLTTVRAQTTPVQEIVVVDNASTDGAPDVARKFGCRVIEMGENAGFARAVNAGWRAAAEGWIAILNSDVELDAEWLKRLAAWADVRGDSVSFATGTIFDATRRQIVDGTYDLVSRAGCGWRVGHGEAGQEFVEAAQGFVRVAMVPATACLYRRAVLASLGGFDESYESYLEDVDLGLRCVSAGFGGIYVPDALAWHHGSATLGRWNERVVRLTSRNQLRLVARHCSAEVVRAWRWPIFVGQALWGLVALRHGAFVPWVEGKVEGLREFRAEGSPTAELLRFFAESEAEIAGRAVDPYWKWYFRLTWTRERGAAH